MKDVYIHRIIDDEIIAAMQNFPVVALIGPRQCGKSTSSKNLLKNFPNAIYLDLERPSDLAKLDDSEWFLSSVKDKVICIDEVQRSPNLFPIIRSLVDEWGLNGKFLLLGSASAELLKQTSESLAGRIVYKKMSPFSWIEINQYFSLEKYFECGGFPRSIIPHDLTVSLEWRESFISTFLERDLLQWSGVSPTTMRRMWQMIAHYNGQIVNYSTLGNSLGVSHNTIKNYIDLLENTFMVKVIKPYYSNLGKRLSKSPKIYIADAGITISLLNLTDFVSITGHPGFGSIWEQMVLSTLQSVFPRSEFFYYRTSNGSEIDFVMKLRDSIFAIECKATSSPKITKGNHFAINDISPKYTYVVAPVKHGWAMQKSIEVVSLTEMIKGIKEKLHSN